MDNFRAISSIKWITLSEGFPHLENMLLPWYFWAWMLFLTELSITKTLLISTLLNISQHVERGRNLNWENLQAAVCFPSRNNLLCRVLKNTVVLWKLLSIAKRAGARGGCQQGALARQEGFVVEQWDNSWSLKKAFGWLYGMGLKCGLCSAYLHLFLEKITSQNLIQCWNHKEKKCGTQSLQFYMHVLLPTRGVKL